MIYRWGFVWTNRRVMPRTRACTRAHDNATASLRLSLLLINANVIERRPGRITFGNKDLRYLDIDIDIDIDR